MSDGRSDRQRRLAATGPPVDEDAGSGMVFGGLCILLLISTFLVAGPWAGFHGVLLGCLGLLIWLRPSQVPLPAVWWWLALAFILAASAAFLPARWFHEPEWRSQLESLGVETGPLVAIQSRQAAEALALFAVTLFVGFWMAGHRPTAAQLRLWALIFTLGVACYALIARLAQDSPHLSGTFGTQHFGFFPNRNHSATYLSMGAVCGLGSISHERNSSIHLSKVKCLTYVRFLSKVILNLLANVARILVFLCSIDELGPGTGHHELSSGWEIPMRLKTSPNTV